MLDANVEMVHLRRFNAGDGLDLAQGYVFQRSVLASGFLQAHPRPPDSKHLARLQWSWPLDLVLADERSVTAAQILDVPYAIFEGQGGVLAGNLAVVREDHVAVLTAANDVGIALLGP